MAKNTMSVEDELRVLRNFIGMLPKTYRKRTSNWVIVRDIIMFRTSTAGCTSCMEECGRLGIDPNGYTLGGEHDD